MNDSVAEPRRRYLYNNAVHVSSPGDLPAVEHFAIIYSTTTDDGGGRSPSIEYRAFLNRQDWEDEIQDLVLKAGGRTFKAMRVQPVAIKVTAEIK